jgi:hypothetical protein
MSIDESAKNEAIFGGLIGLAAAFLALHEYIMSINETYFISLISLFLLVCLLRVVGTMMEIELWNKLANEIIFQLITVPFTVFFLVRILITQVLNVPSIVDFLSILPFLFSGFTFGMILAIQFEIQFDFKVIFNVHKRKKKSEAGQPNQVHPPVSS